MEARKVREHAAPCDVDVHGRLSFDQAYDICRILWRVTLKPPYSKTGALPQKMGTSCTRRRRRRRVPGVLPGPAAFLPRIRAALTLKGCCAKWAHTPAAGAVPTGG